MGYRRVDPDLDTISQNPDAAAHLLALYCSDRPRACGPQLLNQLRGMRLRPLERPLTRIQTAGISPRAFVGLGRALGFGGRIARFGKWSGAPFREKLNNIATHMTPRDLRAAARELRGEVVARKPDGTPFNHVHEVRDAQNGLQNVINQCNRNLRDPNIAPTLTPAERAAFTADLERATKMLEITKKFVPRR
jgi:Bacterial toxin 28